MPKRNIQGDNDFLTFGLTEDGESDIQISFNKALDLTRELQNLGLSAALDASLLTANSLLAALSGRCRRSAPPAEIEITTDAKGDLIYQCKHKNPHTWPI